MPHVVTQACCGDASCVFACPVNCIHPTPDEPDFATAEMLYVDPSTCVDCGACVSACPVGAIVPDHRLPAGQERFVDLNARHYAAAEAPSTSDAASMAARFPVDHVLRLPLAPAAPPSALRAGTSVDVGIVGSGPSAMYAADELLRHPQVSVTIYERLDRPFGLARFGVAPDHLSTRSVMRLFDEIARDARLRILLNTEIGRDITLDEVRRRHDAVIWAGGAPTDRPIEIPGTGLGGVASATSFVGWYNDHPDFADLDVDLSTDRAVVIGNGNVALDVARILVTDPGELVATTIAPRALEVLRRSEIEEVVVVGRRGPADAAFTLPELVGLADSGVPITVDEADLAPVLHPDSESPGAPGVLDDTSRAKNAVLQEIAARRTPSGRRIRLAFWESPAEFTGTGRVSSVTLRRNRIGDGPTGIEETGQHRDLPAGLVLTAVGYRGVAVPGLPFDAATGTVPHRTGRVVDGDAPVRGVYVTGWIKRGPSGFIGTNKSDSAETVAALLEDLSGR